MLPQKPQTPFPIVGIGASAGGLAALDALFSSLPTTERPNVAFVVVQHLSPERKSLLPELLARHVNLPVREICDHSPIEPNIIYVAPPGKLTSCANGNFEVKEFELRHQNGKHPIDHLFHSLARSQTHLACAIVLSGSGFDGAAGVESIKNHSGLVAAETPESAEFESMPRAAIATGLVDFVLPPTQIIPAVIAYFKRSQAQFESLQMDALEGDAVLPELFKLLEKESGQDFSQYKRGTVSRRLMRRMAVHQLTRLSDYLALLRDNRDETLALFRELCIGVTAFFRDNNVFHSLETTIIPELFQNANQHEGVRAWVAGCSTGEEAYSLAMLLAEHEEQNNKPIQVLATDLDARAITFARAGSYPASITTDITESRLSRFFTKESGGKTFRVSRTLRDLVIFSEHNLIKDPPFSRLDFISCRNLLIYLDAELQRKVITLFHHALKPGGILLLGSSENAGEPPQLFTSIDRNLKLFRRVDHPPEGIRSTTHRYFPTRAPERPLRRSPEIEPAPPIQTTRALTERAILQQFIPTAVLVNEQGDIIYIHGRAGQYLEPTPDSPGSNNVFKMAREGLKPVLRTLLRQVVAGASVAQTTGVRVRTNGHHIRVSVSIQPVEADTWLSTPGENKPPFYLIALNNLGDNDAALPLPIADLSQDAELRIRSLLQELDAKEEQLQATREALENSNQELMSSNEELQSINEELQATNEELETSKEELQSVNEELYTVNSELQTKVADLTNANNDILNLLAGTGVATIFLDRSLCIMRFTPSVAKIIKIIPSDVGRPIGDLVLNLKNYNTMEQDASHVLCDSILITRDVQTHDGNWYSLKIQPYRTQEEKIEGIAITFGDISERKRAEQALSESEEKYRSIVDTANEGIWLLDAHGMTTFTNNRMAEMLGYESHEMIGKSLFDFMSAEAASEAQNRLEKRRKGVSEKHDFCFQRKDGSDLWAMLSTSAIMDKTGNFVAALGLVTDITERKHAEQKERELHAMLEKFIEYSPIYAYLQEVSPTECRALYTSANFVHLTGIPADKMSGKTMAELFPPDFAAKISADSWQIFSEGKVSELEEELQGRFYQTIKFPVSIGGKRLLAGYTIDITERKLADQSLRESEERFRNIFNRSPMGIAIVDSRTAEFRMVNPALANMTGYSIEELATVDWVAITHPDDVQPDLDLMAKMNAGKIPGFELEKRYKHRNGNYFWVKITIAPMDIADQTKPHHVLIVDDITLRKQAQENLQESEKRYRFMFNTMQEGVALHEIICDSKGKPCDYRWIDLNPAYEAMTGLQRDRVLGRRVLEMLPQLEPVWIENFGHVAITGEPLSFEDSAAEIGKSFAVSAYCPQIGQFAVLVRDITKERESERMLRMAKDAAEAANKAKSQFLANMSHELRTPLNPIIGFSELLSIAPNLTDEQRHWLDLVTERGNDLLELISDILDLAKIEAGKLTLAPVPLSLRELIKNLTDTVLPAVSEKGLNLETVVNPALPDALRLDGLRLRQILLNLISNSIKFTKQGKIAIGITVAPAEKLNRPLGPNEVGLLLHVVDTGIGVPADKQQIIFEAFQQASEGHAAQFGGAGLGLSIASNLVSLMGGTIWVESEPGKGSLFSFTIIASLSDSNAEERAPQSQCEQAKRQLNILIAEDDPCSAMVIEEIIKLRGDKSKTVSDGEKALALLEQENFDLILLDVRMPILDGIEVTKRLRKKNNATIIVAITAHALDENKKECLAAGMNEYLTKPVSVEALNKAIDRLLSS